jgi:hypothetical protein
MPKTQTLIAYAEPAHAEADHTRVRNFRGPCNFYRDVFGGWRWEFEDSNGEMRDSQHAYATREQCVAAATGAGLPTSEEVG